jgi:[ribosomal protein S18]-alanine N-acetyltransferase
METAPAMAPRRLEPADAPAVARLEAACFPDPWSEAVLEAAFGRPTFAAWGIDAPGGLVAYATLHLIGDELEILNVAVDRAWRGQGLGGRLLGCVLQQTDKMGMNRGYLEVRAGNEPAKRLYLRHGFVVAGRRERYYADSGEDALVMVRETAAALVAHDRSTL